MRLNGILGLTLIGFAGFALADVAATRCGGDGPTPLSVDTRPTQTQLGTVGQVQDFQVWETRNEVVYRNDRGGIFRVNLGSGANKAVTSSSRPLTHFADPKERFLLTDSGSYFFDVFGDRRWIQFNQSVPAMQHVFWDNDDLYSVASTFNSDGRQTLRVYRYTAGDDYTVPLCGNLTFDPGRGYALANGHSFPQVFLYQTTTLSQGTLIDLYALNVLNCDVTPITSFKHLIDGPVQAVYHFAKQGATAVKIDHPTRNWMWDPGDGACQFYDIGNVPPILVNRQLPVIATWSPLLSGVTLYDFRHPSQGVPKTVVLDGATAVHGLGADDLYLTQDGKRLFARPLLGSRPLAPAPMFQVNLRNFLTPVTRR